MKYENIGNYMNPAIQIKQLNKMLLDLGNAN